MARKPRIHLTDGFYHVILRGNGGQDLFLRDEDRYRFFLLLQEGTFRFKYRVHAFCFMTNHIHLIVQAGDMPLSRGMQNLSFRYTRWINWRENRTGHLFQGRYKALLIDDDSYLLELVRYIHLNPVRAGIVKSAEDHLWSSHRSYLGKYSIPWLTTDQVLGRFGKHVGKARAAYQQFVVDGMEEEYRAEFHHGFDDPRIVGNEAFTESALGAVDECVTRVPLATIITHICSKMAIDFSLLSAPTQARRVTEARAIIGWLAREMGAATLSEIARRFNRDVGTISSAVRRLEDRAGATPVLAEHLRSFLKSLSELANLEA